ncbi:ABC-F family ATP-binding cassette domain-containing protein [Actinospongicola halichondriae]|uniref:ABC-F family ATP-binding cassette domain-containing protein n=1 Tax=Actinospongicola halichondriae TaxID=3236844 RepID=UPI003D3D46BD
MSSQIVAQNVAFSHGPTVVLADVSLTVASGHRIGVLGPNGVGKSTLLRLLVGDLTPESGSVRRVPGDARVGFLTQELDIRAGESVADVVARRTGAQAAQVEFDAATQALGSGDVGADDRYQRALDTWMQTGAADFDATLAATLERVGLGASTAGQDASTLSGGERARVNLASVLLSGFDVLALDEPTNDLDLDGLRLLEEFLVGSTAGFVLVSHDRAFLERVVTSVLEIDEHDRTATRYDGGWNAYQQARATARRHAEEAHADYVDARESLRGQAQRTREWSAQGLAKVKRSDEPDKFIRHWNTASSEKLAGKAKRAEKALERLEVVEKPWEGWDLRLDFATTGRSGDRVIETRDLVVDRGSFRLGPISLDVGYGERVALVGANGSGKTTLLQAALGRVEPSSGTARLGPSVVVGTLDQARRRFATDESLIDAFVAETGVMANDARSQLAKLGLGPDHIGRSTDRLSPGERTRAVLAAFALVGVNLLVLDEPTNHLDLPAIEQLEAALDGYPGTLVLVTHDRQLLEAVTLTRTIELSDGRVVGDVAV